MPLIPATALHHIHGCSEGPATSVSLIQQYHTKIIILPGIPSLSVQRNVFIIIPNWLCLGCLSAD